LGIVTRVIPAPQALAARPMPVLGWVFLAFLALAPLPLGGNRPIFWNLNALALGALLLAAAAGPLRARLGLAGLGWPLALMLAVLGWIIIQALPGVPAALVHEAWLSAAAPLGMALPGSISIAPDATLAAALRLLSDLAAFWLGWALLRGARAQGLLLTSIACAALAYSLYGLLDMAMGWRSVLWLLKQKYHGDLTATFINRNHFAVYGAIALAAVAELLCGARRPARVLLLVGAGLMIGLAVLLTHSRAGVAVAVAAPALVLLLRAMVVARHWVWRLAAIAALLLAGLAAIATALFTVLAPRVATIGSEAAERLAVWRLSWEALWQRPLLGHGFGAFEELFPMLRDDSLRVWPSWDHAHNIYLEAALGLGLPAFVALAVAIVWLLCSCLRVALREQRETAVVRVALAGFLAAAAQSALEFSLHIPAISLLVAALLGAAAARALAREAPIRQVFIDPAVILRD